MNPGLEDGNPEHYGQQQIGRLAHHAETVHCDGQRQCHRADDQARDRQVFGVEQGDDGDRGKVVEDGQGQQEELQRQRHARAERHQQRQREGNVGRHRYGPTIHRDGIAPVEPGVHRCRNHHAAESADTRQHDLGERRKLALEKLALDLEADEEEEDGHEAIVDPEQERLADF